MNAEKNLADALRASIAVLDVAAKHLTGERGRMMQVTADAQRAALAAYNAQQTATNGPWSIRMRHVGGAFIYEDDETLVATCDDEKTAARIIQCVNAHDGLVSALCKVANLQAFAMTDERGMRGDNADELARIIADALVAAGVQP
jgi:hypothetical protein